MGKKSRRDAQKLEEEAAALAASKAAERKAARRVVEVAPPADSATQVVLADPAIENVEEHAAEPASAKPKKARFVREKAAKKTPVKDAPLLPRNTTAAGKMMSRNVTLRPEEERSSGPKDNRATGPKPKSKP